MISKGTFYYLAHLSNIIYKKNMYLLDIGNLNDALTKYNAGGHAYDELFVAKMIDVKRDKYPNYHVYTVISIKGWWVLFRNPYKLPKI